MMRSVPYFHNYITQLPFQEQKKNSKDYLQVFFYFIRFSVLSPILVAIMIILVPRLPWSFEWSLTFIFFDSRFDV